MNYETIKERTRMNPKIGLHPDYFYTDRPLYAVNAYYLENKLPMPTALDGTASYYEIAKIKYTYEEDDYIRALDLIFTLMEIMRISDLSDQDNQMYDEINTYIDTCERLNDWETEDFFYGVEDTYFYEFGKGYGYNDEATMGGMMQDNMVNIIQQFFNSFNTQEDIDNFVKWIYELDNFDHPYKSEYGSILPLFLEKYLLEDVEFEDGIPITKWRRYDYDTDEDNDEPTIGEAHE